VVGDTCWTAAARLADICSEQKSAEAREGKTEWSNDRQSVKWWGEREFAKKSRDWPLDFAQNKQGAL
jgi:hypothetical protein